MTEKYRDFDAFWQEKQDEPIQFTAFGKTYDLPPSPPAAIILEMKKLRKDQGLDGVVAEEQLVMLMEQLLGEDAVQELVDAGMTIEQLEDLMEWIGRQYGFQRTGDDTGNDSE